MQLRSELDSIGAAIDAARLQVTQRVHGDTELLDLATAAHNRAKSEMAASERALEARCASFKATLQTARKLALDALAQAVNHALHLAEALAWSERSQGTCRGAGGQCAHCKRLRRNHSQEC